MGSFFGAITDVTMKVQFYKYIIFDSIFDPVQIISTCFNNYFNIASRGDNGLCASEEFDVVLHFKTQHFHSLNLPSQL